MFLWGIYSLPPSSDLRLIVVAVGVFWCARVRPPFALPSAPNGLTLSQLLQEDYKRPLRNADFVNTK